MGRKFKPLIWEWLAFVSTLKTSEIEQTYEYNGQTHSYITHAFLESKNVNLLKGLVWSLVSFHDKKNCGGWRTKKSKSKKTEIMH